jgi:endonuclease/exonuclease/phosphatase family metal-dependent hydrolase
VKSKSLFLSLIFLCFCICIQAQKYTVGTFNLRYDNPKDSGNLWVNRAPVVASLIRFHQFDVFGTQEGLQNQLEDISRALPEYSRYGIGRDDGNEKGEHSAIFYRKDQFNLLKKGDFWLSETPEKPGPGWDAHLNRICSWVQLKDKKSGRTFYFFNVHYDHQGIKAREESSKLILTKIKEIAGKDPVVFTGDFNGDHQSQWYQTIAGSGTMKDSYQVAEQRYANNGSFNGFGSTVGRNEIIDHIFISPSIKVSRYGILTDTYHGKYPSDHFPILADIQL